MNVYLFLLLIILFLCFLENYTSIIKIGKYSIRTRKISFIICFTFILCLGIFRAELLGVDVYNYKEYFYSWYPSYSFREVLMNFKMDNGYILLNKIIYFFTKNFWIAKSIIYIISFGLISFIIYRHSKYPALSFLIYVGFGYLGFSFCILRQSLALSICLYAYKYVEMKNFKLFLLLVIIAGTFHKTAYAYLIIYPIINYQFFNYQFLKKIFIIIFFVLGIIFIFPFLINIYTIDYSNSIITGEGFNLLLIFMFIYFILYFFNKKYNMSFFTKKEKDIIFMPVYFQIVALFFSLLTRITNYYSIMLIVIIPNIIYKSKSTILLIIFILLFSFLFLNNLISNPTSIVPYISIFK